MNIEIHNPDLVQRVTAHIQTGHFHNVDEVIEKALGALDEKKPTPAQVAALRRKNFVELCDPVRGLAEDIEFSRNPSTARHSIYERLPSQHCI